MNREHAHFSRNIFADCNECKNSSNGNNSNSNERAGSAMRLSGNSKNKMGLAAHKQAPLFLRMSNNLLSMSCSEEKFNYRERAQSLMISIGSEQRMPA